MKGISAVIAAILMLMITMALAGVAYFYISGIFASKTTLIEAVGDADVSKTGTTCTISWYVRNIGTSTITATLKHVTACTSFTADGVFKTDGGTFNVNAGATSTLVATGCAANSNAVYKIHGPSNTVSLIAFCP